MKTFLLCCLTTLLSLKGLAQDIHFAQMSQAPSYLNPALTALGNKNTRFSALVRQQWAPALGENAYKTVLATFEHQEKVFQQDQVGFGLSLFSDQAGELKLRQNQANLSFSYSKRLVKSTYYQSNLLLGLYAGVGQRSIQYDLARWGSQFDLNKLQFDPSGSAEGVEGLARQYVYSDAGAGLLWYIKGVKRNSGGGYFGAALSHFAGSHREFSREQRNPLPVKYTVHAGAELPLQGKMYFLPSLVSFAQGDALQVNAGAAISMTINATQDLESELVLGAWIRLSNHPAAGGTIKPESLVPVARLKFNDWAVGLSYDFPLSELSSAAIGNGALELSLNYSFNQVMDRRIKCPRIF